MAQETVRIKDADNPHGREINRADFDPKEHEYFARDTPAPKAARGRKTGKPHPVKRTAKKAATSKKVAQTRAPVVTKAVDRGGKSE